MDDKVKIVLNSIHKKRQYKMYDDKIIVKSNDEEICIEMPQMDKNIGFYDMYYSSGYIHVVVATRGNYDIRYILDEDKLKLINEHFTK